MIASKKKPKSTPSQTTRIQKSQLLNKTMSEIKMKKLKSITHKRLRDRINPMMVDSVKATDLSN